MGNRKVTQKMSNSIERTSSVFKPLIASSLALALGVSVGMAQNITSTQDISNNGVYNIYVAPGSKQGITVNIGTSAKVELQEGSMIGNQANWSGTTSPLIVNFKNGSTLTGSIIGGTAQNGNNYSGNQVTFVGGSGIVMTGDIISYGTGPANQQNPVVANANQIAFTNGSMKGDIVASSMLGRYAYNEVTFSENNASVTGNITSDRKDNTSNGKGKNKITFSGTGGSISGKISAGLYGINEIIFKANGSVVNINADSGQNTINAATSLAIIGNITTNAGSNIITANSLTGTIGNMSANGGGTGVNSITVDSAANIQFGDIRVSGNGFSHNKNSITITSLTGALTLNSLEASGGSINTANPLLSGDINQIEIGTGKLIINTGGIKALDGGNNIINAGTLTLNDNGGISASGGITSYNTITLSTNDNLQLGAVSINGNSNTNSKNTISITSMGVGKSLTIASLSAGGGTLTNSSSTSGNINDINLGSNGTLKITSNGVRADSGGNNIIVANSLVLVDNGNITTSGGYSSYNTITLSGTGGLSFGHVTANGNGNTHSKNTISAINMAANQYLTIQNLSAYSGTSGEGNGNQISLGSAGALKVLAIETSGNGYNTITAKAAEVGGDISASGGTNSITLTGDLTWKDGIAHNIVSSGGNNTISAVNMAKAGNITTSGGYTGVNTITLSGTSDVAFGDVIANGNKNTNSKNIITIQGLTGTLSVNSLQALNGTVKGQQASSGNINQINLGNGGTLQIASGGVKAGSGGNNIIDAKNLVLTDKGNITIEFGGYSSYNTINLTGTDTETTVGAISVDGNNNTNSINTLNVANNLYVMNSITTNEGSKSGGKLGNQNIITVNKVLAVNVSALDGVTLPSPLPPVADGVSSKVANVVAFSANKGTNTIKAMENALILGQINATNGGTNNIYIKDSNGMTSSVTNPNYIGSATANGGANNIIFDGGFWMPNSVSGGNGGSATNPNYGADGSGKLTTTNWGTSNIIFRQGQNNPLGTDVAHFMVSNGANSNTNIVMQSNIAATHVNIEVDANYTTSGSINLIFASANSMTPDTTDNFTVGTDIANDTLFGVKYKGGVKLTLQDRTIEIGNERGSLLNAYGYLYADEDGSTAKITSRRNASAKTDTVVVDGFVVGTIKALEASDNDWNYNVTLEKGSAYAGSISLASGSNVSLTMAYDTNRMMGSKLILTDGLTQLKTLSIDNGQVDTTQLQLETLSQNNTVVNLATGGAAVINTATRKDFRVLEIGSNTPATDTGLVGQGGAVFVNYINANANQDVATIAGVSVNQAGGKAYADRIVVHNVGDNSQASTAKFYMQLAVDADTKLSSIKYTEGGTATEGNIAVATIAKVNNVSTPGASVAGASVRAIEDDAAIRAKGVISIQEADVMQGFDQIHGTLKAVETRANGTISDTEADNTYVTYFVNSMETKGATEATQGVSASALATNYDLYIANFNSLNKRMGELRDNDNSQGAWIRIFNGSQTNDFGLGTTTSYTTFQGGYDYAFGFEGANNYLGVAVAYGMSTSKTKSNAFNAVSGNIEGIEDIKSSLVEVALYNSYVQDSGWYNDTIFKFSYVMSDFTMMLGSDAQSTSNMAYTFSDEFGYRFKLGSENEWYIDPQAELSFGYFDQTDFVQKLGRATLNSQADSLMTLRTRFGSSFGYDFKKFTADKPIKASVYVGAFYEYDYIKGGDINLETNLGGTNTLASSLQSDGRVVMNLGTNMTVKDNTRIYFDFESSFAGKINTDYQVNVGVRYSFGENVGYTPMTAKKEVAPLKISDENKAEEKVEVSKEAPVENADAQAQEKKAQ